MEDSAMDMTEVCNMEEEIARKEFFRGKESCVKCEVLLQENYELKNKVEVLESINKEIESELSLLSSKVGRKSDLDLSVSLDVSSSKMVFQENHELKKKIEILEKVNLELENDINYISAMKAKESTRLISIREELECANSKIKKLESSLEEERAQGQRLSDEIRESRGNIIETNAIVVPDQEQLNILTSQIEKLEIQNEENQNSIKELLEEKATLVKKVNEFCNERTALQNELKEFKEHLDQKTNDLQNVNSTLEALREDKLLLTTEIQMLKAVDTNATRGNSLFAEVEENRQKMAAQREVLKLKYLNLKKVLNQKLVENNKLKLEIIKIRREENEDEKTVHRDYSDLIQTYKQRIGELEEQVKVLEQKDQSPIVLSGSDDSQWQWVHTAVENSRQEVRSLKKELERRGSNYVTQGHQLFDSQRENRKLKAANNKLRSEIDELKLQLDTVKSANRDAQDLQDGISPPATEVAVEYQKQKMVKFKEVLQKQINTSNSNTSSGEHEISGKEEIRPDNLLSIKIEEDKENL